MNIQSRRLAAVNRVRQWKGKRIMLVTVAGLVALVYMCGAMLFFATRGSEWRAPSKTIHIGHVDEVREVQEVEEVLEVPEQEVQEESRNEVDESELLEWVALEVADVVRQRDGQVARRYTTEVNVPHIWSCVQSQLELSYSVVLIGSVRRHSDTPIVIVVADDVEISATAREAFTHYGVDVLSPGEYVNKRNNGDTALQFATLRMMADRVGEVSGSGGVFLPPASLITDRRFFMLFTDDYEGNSSPIPDRCMCHHWNDESVGSHVTTESGEILGHVDGQDDIRAWLEHNGSVMRAHGTYARNEESAMACIASPNSYFVVLAPSMMGNQVASLQSSRPMVGTPAESPGEHDVEVYPKVNYSIGELWRTACTHTEYSGYRHHVINDELRKYGLEQRTVTGPMTVDRQCGIVLMMTNSEYLEGILTLVYSLRRTIRNGQLPIDIAVIVTTAVDDPNEVISLLRGAGVDNIKFMNRIQTRARSGNNIRGFNWTVLYAWSFFEYERVIYLDLDMLVTKPVHELCSDSWDEFPDRVALRDNVGIPNVHVAGSLNWVTGQKTWENDTFNGGFFVTEPDPEVFKELMQRAVHFNTVGVQPFLNEQFAHALHLLDELEYNINSWVSRAHNNLWDWARVRLIHYTWIKPWRFTTEVAGGPVKVWQVMNAYTRKRCEAFADIDIV